MLRNLKATRYITPLREGGSLPAVVEADDGQLYVLKFRGAGQGLKALISELLGGEIARALGLRVPELVLMELDPAFGRNEPDEEIQDLLKASVGQNLALAYLGGSLAYEPAASPRPDPVLASSIVWLDAFITNVDRTARNTNMLIWQKQLWLIDHAASLYFHYTWADFLERSKTPFSPVKDHVLLPFAGVLSEVHISLRKMLTEQKLAQIVELIPEGWLENGPHFASKEEQRNAYFNYLISRLFASDIFVEEAINARAKLL
jgi:hypothetical protein